MTDQPSKEDRVLSDLVMSAVVPDGYRPQSDKEIERMLDSLGSQPISAEKRDRMLGKALGRISKRWEDEHDRQSRSVVDSNESRELAEMHREKGEDLPPQLEERLRQMEERASEPPGDEDDSDE